MSMASENKYGRTRDPFKMFLKESLEQQWNEMMENFAKILRWLLISDASTTRGGAAPFKLQINFDIPIFEGQIDANVINKWLNLIEGYFSVHKFPDRENITFVLLKSIPHVKD
jgi:hypothetical protein